MNSRIATILGVTALTALLAWGLIGGWARSTVALGHDLLALVESFAPYSTALVALVAGVIAWVNYRHRRIADNRAEWWRRTQYAIDLTCTDDDKIGRNTGMRLLTHLLKDRSATQADAELLEDTVDALVDEVVARGARRARDEELDASSPSRKRGALRHRLRAHCKARR